MESERYISMKTNLLVELLSVPFCFLILNSTMKQSVFSHPFLHKFGPKGVASYGNYFSELYYLRKRYFLIVWNFCVKLGYDSHTLMEFGHICPVFPTSNLEKCR